MSFTLQDFNEMTAVNPVIASVKNDEGLKHCNQSECGIAFILYGNICNISDIVEEVKAIGKKAIVHVDLIEGLSTKEISVDFIQKFTDADGIISTKPGIIRRANEIGMFCVQRFFMMDSISYFNIVKYAKSSKPDVIELMPAGLNKIITLLMEEIDKPVIASGLIYDKDDIFKALSAGAQAISTTYSALW
jgi:glycerol uptake operon antiterminator